jgi:diphthamide biosynthesis methyltransferase
MRACIRVCVLVVYKVVLSELVVAMQGDAMLSTTHNQLLACLR